MTNRIKTCEFNIDTACVEVKLTDGSMVSIDCIAVENEYANNMYETSKLDYLIYNKPMSYVRLWSLSPAYDVTFSYRKDSIWVNAQQMFINGKSDAIKCIEQVRTSVSKW